MTTRKLIEILKPGLSLLLTTTLALGQQVTGSQREAPAAREQSAVWGGFKPETNHPNAARDLGSYREKEGTEALRGDDEIDVIVQYRDHPEQNAERAVKRGAKLSGVLGNAVLPRMTRQAAFDLAEDPDVVYVSPDREVSASGNDIDYSSVTVSADKANKSGATGKGIRVAVIDSGVDPDNEDLAARDCNSDKRDRVVYEENFVTWAEEPGSYGHGTHVTAILTGNGCVAKRSGKNYQQAPGIAPEAEIVSLRALDSRGKGKDSSLIAAIDRAIALKTEYKIRVINISAGRMVRESYTKDPLCRAVERAWKAGIVVVVAAGNNGRDNSMGTNGYGTIGSPGNDPFVITVGAVNDKKSANKSDDILLTFSSKGPTLIDQYVKPDIMAPGANVLASKPLDSYLQTQFPNNTLAGDEQRKIPNDAYFWLSGTSMATPMVSGAAALLLDKEPTLTPDQVKARLMRTATKNFPSQTSWKDSKTNITYTAYSDLFTVGAGYLDVMAALTSTDNIAKTQSAKSPRVRVLAGGVVETYNDASGVPAGTNVVWGENGVWGNNVVWGNTVLVKGTNVVWGNSMVWGSSTAAGYNVVWGNSVVWGNASPFMESTSINGEN